MTILTVLDMRGSNPLSRSMKTIKFYPSNRSLIRLDGKMIKGYKLNDVPYERNSWFNYKGLTFVID